MIHALTKTSLALALIAALPVASSIAEPNAPRVAAPAVIDAQDPIKFSFEGGTASGNYDFEIQGTALSLPWSGTVSDAQLDGTMAGDDAINVAGTDVAITYDGTFSYLR